MESQQVTDENAAKNVEVNEQSKDDATPPTEGAVDTIEATKENSEAPKEEEKVETKNEAAATPTEVTEVVKDAPISEPTPIEEPGKPVEEPKVEEKEKEPIAIEQVEEPSKEEPLKEEPKPISNEESIAEKITAPAVEKVDDVAAIPEKEVRNEETPPPLPVSPPPTPVSVLAQSTMAETVPNDILVKATLENLKITNDTENQQFSVVQVAASDSTKEIVENLTSESIALTSNTDLQQTKHENDTNSSNLIEDKNSIEKTDELKELNIASEINKDSPVSETISQPEASPVVESVPPPKSQEPSTVESVPSPQLQESSVLESVPPPQPKESPIVESPPLPSPKEETKVESSISENIVTTESPKEIPLPEPESIPEPIVESSKETPVTEALPNPPEIEPVSELSDLPTPPKSPLSDSVPEPVPELPTSPEKSLELPALNNDISIPETQSPEPVLESSQSIPKPIGDDSISSPVPPVTELDKSIEIPSETLPDPPSLTESLSTDQSADLPPPPPVDDQIVAETDKNTALAVELPPPAEQPSSCKINDPVSSSPNEVTDLNSHESAPEPLAEKVESPQEESSLPSPAPPAESVPVTSAPLLDESLLSNNVAPEIKQENNSTPTEEITNETKLDESRGDVPKTTPEKTENAIPPSTTTTAEE